MVTAKPGAGTSSVYSRTRTIVPPCNPHISPLAVAYKTCPIVDSVAAGVRLTEDYPNRECKTKRSPWSERSLSRQLVILMDPGRMMLCSISGEGTLLLGSVISASDISCGLKGFHRRFRRSKI